MGGANLLCPPAAVPPVEDDQVEVRVQGQSRHLPQQEGALGPRGHLLQVGVCIERDATLELWGGGGHREQLNSGRRVCVSVCVLRV